MNKITLNHPFSYRSNTTGASFEAKSFTGDNATQLWSIHLLGFFFLKLLFVLVFKKYNGDFKMHKELKFLKLQPREEMGRVIKTFKNHAR
jgi:hypothetical protein